MKREKIKWGIIGPGKIARKFAISLKFVEDAELYAIASRNPERAAAFAEEMGTIKSYSSYETMLEDPAIDIIYVATPHSFHHPHTLLCLNAGKPVLCEKPFALNRQEVEEMILTSHKRNVFLMEAMWTIFLPHIGYVKEIIDSGKFGKVKTLKADFGFDTPFDAEGRLFLKSLGGGSLMDIGIYPVFLALHLLGTPKKIKATAKLGKTGIDEHCDIIFKYSGDTTALLHSSIIEKTPTLAVIELEAASIKISPNWYEPTAVSITSKKGTETKVFEAASFGYEFEARHVQEMLRQNKTESEIMSFDKSLELISILDKIRKQIGLEF
ncbi:Predicted dehydrogenase [Salinimicrobium sediminis]|uniref:Predicted dehydrogenase n=1 Tax=Salinimicrobium sediminis TaxID=1343891 RepID=A0A285X8S4_9FLAO|nr:Gfo/Idh/MocA family oxidoreductase [Salinimicrobium sediminis]SOC81194.1 Predicted dehydrogenase [Salinimicrobium sediminis]